MGLKSFKALLDTGTQVITTLSAAMEGGDIQIQLIEFEQALQQEREMK